MLAFGILDLLPINFAKYGTKEVSVSEAIEVWLAHS